MAPDRSAPLPPTLDAGVRAFLDGSPAATIAIRLDGRVAYANPAYATLIGEPDPAALADRSIGFGTWHDGAAALAACRATQAQGAWQGPLTARPRDGTPVPVSCAARMLADADGREDTLLITLLPRTDAAPQPPSPGDDASLMQAVVGAAGGGRAGRPAGAPVARRGRRRGRGPGVGLPPGGGPGGAGPAGGAPPRGGPPPGARAAASSGPAPAWAGPASRIGT